MDASGYPITGDGTVVMNFVRILRKANGHDFGRPLIENMTKTVKDASGLATIA